MRRNVFCEFKLALVVAVFACPAACAQSPPDILSHYRLLPRLSILHQTGGFAGVDWRYRLIGSYDLQRSLGWTGTASFENAEIWGSIISPNPTPAVVLDVDQVLNLEGLKGEALPVAAPFDVYQFTGTTGDGSSVRLLASLIGPWMYIRGGTQPPPGSADYFTYTISALARSPRPFADLNHDGNVDAADYVMLRENFATANPDGVVLADWFQQFGEKLPDVAVYDTMLTAALGSLNPTSAVPEPATCVLVLLGTAMFLMRRR